MRTFLFPCVITTATLFLASHVFAQVNIEKFRKTDLDRGESGFVEFDLSSRSGNVDITELSVDCRSDFVRETTDSFIVLRGDYGWAKGETFSDEALLHTRHIRRLDKRVRTELFAQIDYNKKRLLDFRGLAGAGIRMSVYRQKRFTSWWGTAAMYEREELDIAPADRHDETSNAVRWSNYLTTNVAFDDRIGWSSTTYVQPDFGDFADVRILCDTNLNVDLNRRLSLVVSFRLRYDSDPPETIEKTDTRLGTGLALRY